MSIAGFNEVFFIKSMKALELKYKFRNLILQNAILYIGIKIKLILYNYLKKNYLLIKKLHEVKI